MDTFRTTGMSFSNWIFYRLADVKLMKAEALCQVGKVNDDKDMLTESLNLVKEIRLRSTAPETTNEIANDSLINPAELERFILLERAREFAHEGKRWFDLMRIVKRTQDATSILKYIGPKLTGDNLQIKKMSVIDALYMPVHQSQIDINPNLTQNPFYEDAESSSSN